MNEKRRYERLAFFCPVCLDVLSDGPAVSAYSYDISIGGVGVIADITLERGTHVRVRFQLRNDLSEIVEEEVLGRIAHTRADENGNHVGIEFLTIVQESSQPALSKQINKL